MDGRDSKKRKAEYIVYTKKYKIRPPDSAVIVRYKCSIHSNIDICNIYSCIGSIRNDYPDGSIRNTNISCFNIVQSDKFCPGYIA